VRIKPRGVKEAVGHQLDRADQEIVFRVVSSYYDVLLAAKELEVAEQSAKTAQSIMDRSQARQHRRPPLQRTQGWGTLFGNGARRHH
jgi:hypothetical protein